MPRELIIIQVGQCGNQIGLSFWELALKEFAVYNKSKVYTEPLSSLFMNYDHRSGTTQKVGSPLSDIKARALVIDMECGVIQHKVKNGPLRELFGDEQFITDNPGSGNNW